MQLTDQVYYNQRALYYWSKLYTSQLKKGDAFDGLRKTISINILNFDYFDDEPDYHNVFHLLNAKSHRRYFEDLELHFIELQKFDKDLSHLKTALDRWSTFLNSAGQYNQGNMPSVLKQEPALEQAVVMLNTLNLDDRELEIYEARLKWLRDEDATLKKARIDASEQRSIDIAKKLLVEGVDSKLIARTTGLHDDMINELQALLRDLSDQ